MIFVDKPFVSDFFRETAVKHKYPIVLTNYAKALGFGNTGNIINEADAIERITGSDNIRLYTTSENAIGWIVNHLSSTGLPAKIDLFKNKVKFRTLTKPLFPDFYFQEVALEDIALLSEECLPYPFVIKPATGFFSMGVFNVSSKKEWAQAKTALFKQIGQTAALYPKAVLNTASFIIEKRIQGEEYAMDAYFNAAGEPVILSIYKHVFSSAKDVRDRLYITSKSIMKDNMEPFTKFLGDIGSLTDVRNFPVHVEIRRDNFGRIMPVEINPMRFGGWCTTADMMHYAYGFNPYVYYFNQQVPDWNALLKNKSGKVYGIIILDNATGIDSAQIRSFDYDQLVAGFENPLALRKINYNEYPVFGFLFTETSKQNFSELESILNSNLKEYISVSKNH